MAPTSPMIPVSFKLFIFVSHYSRRRRVAGVQLVGAADPTDAGIVDEGIADRIDTVARNAEDVGDTQILET